MTHDGLPNKEVIPVVSLVILTQANLLFVASRRMLVTHLSFARFPLGEDGNQVALSHGGINLR